MKCLSVLLLLLPALAKADFSGHWMGAGKLTTYFGVSDCGNVDFTIKQGTELLEFGGTYECGKVKDVTDALPIEVRGTYLIYDGGKVGEINGDTMSISFEKGDITTSFNVSMRENALSVQKIVVDSSTTIPKYLNFQAVLKK